MRLNNLIFLADFKNCAPYISLKVHSFTPLQYKRLEPLQFMLQYNTVILKNKNT